MDVLVAGGGPAGSAAALVLARAGCSVHLLEATPYTAPRVGEHLPPRAKRVLAELGCADVLTDSVAIDCPGVRASWGRPLEHRDYLFNPEGGGCNLDRARFDRMLHEQARAAGARVSDNTKVDAISRQHDRWRVTTTRGDTRQEVSARLLIDATGRRARLARRLGARRIAFDQLCGVVAWLERPQDPDVTLLVEACENGWWYSLPVPGNRLAAAFMAEADTLKGTIWRSGRRWRTQLERAQLTRARIGKARIVAGPVVRPADSAVLEPLSGDGWLAVGDAALSVDPLSSNGILRALESGRDGANAALRWLDGETAALAAYGQQQSAVLRPYLTERTKVYREVTDWAERPFWKTRHMDCAGIVLSPHDSLLLKAGAASLGVSAGLAEPELTALGAMCTGDKPVSAVVRQFRLLTPHLSDEHVIFALQDLVFRGLVERRDLGRA